MRNGADNGGGTAVREPRGGMPPLPRRLRVLPLLSKGVLVFYVLVSVGVMLSPRYLPDVPRAVRVFLGVSPPVWLINLALVLYSFSAMVLILGRIAQGTPGYKGWSHLAYLLAFYGFYFYAGEVQNFFWGIFIAGLTILVLEDYKTSIYCREEIRRIRAAGLYGGGQEGG